MSSPPERMVAVPQTDRPDGLGVGAVVLQVALYHLLGPPAAHVPGAWAWARRACPPNKIAPGGQHVGPPAGRRAAGAGGHEAAIQSAQQLAHLVGAAGVQARRKLLAQAHQHGGSVCGRPARRRGLPHRHAPPPGRWQQLQALARVAGVAPGASLLRQHGRARPAQGAAQSGVSGSKSRQAQVLRQRRQQAALPRPWPGCHARQRRRVSGAGGPGASCPGCAGRRGSATP